MGDVPQIPEPFGFDLSQLFRMLQSSGPVNWQVAEQVAAWMASADPATGVPQASPGTDPAVAAELDAVVRAAQTAVTELTGLSGANAVASACVDRSAWATATLRSLTGVLDALAGALGRTEEPEAEEEDPLAGIATMVLPLLVGVWAGSMIGFLAQRALGQYDLPLPLEGEPRLAFVAANVDAFATEWSLPASELRYVLAVREVVRAAQRSVPWVRDRLVRGCRDFVGGYELRPDALGGLSGLDLTEVLGGLEDAVGGPDELLGAMRSERQEPMLEELQRFVSVLEGYADVVTTRIGAPMTTSFPQIDEALRRRRVERGQAGAFVDRLLGLELGPDEYERGLAFCRGVLDRAGFDGLNRLWEREEMVPTAAELTAPGLWLARIELPD